MRPTILLIDDNEDNLFLLDKLLQRLPATAGVIAVGFTSAPKALNWCHQNQPDMCLVDYMMPEMDGIAFIAEARKLNGFQGIPMVIVTATSGDGFEQRARLSGATDIIYKSLDPDEAVIRIGNLLSLRLSLLNPINKAEQLAGELDSAVQNILQREHELIIQKLSHLSQRRDEETGNHMRRVAHISQLIASELGYDQEFCESIFLAAPLHDIGKIGIPDRILLKPGKLNQDEWCTMQTHATIGYEVLKDGNSALMRMGAEIAHSHHEKYNGLGYPRGLTGESIPIVGRIVAVADELDALLSERPYKRPWRSADVIKTMKKKRGTHFDPKCIDAMLARIEEILEIGRTYSDQKPSLLLTG